MTTTVLLVIAAAVAGLVGARLLDRRRERPVVVRSRRMPDDMFAYTMYDDPC